MKWGLWSQTAASNSATPPDGWPEQQLPSTVNDCAREMMAAIATGLQDIQFIDLGYVPTQVSGNQFTVSGTHADTLHYGRRLKLSDGANTFYGTIISATATTNTAVALRFDAGNAPLDASLSAIAVGSIANFNGAAPDSTTRNTNWFINPALDVWQRGPGSFNVSAGFQAQVCADNWKVGATGGVINVSRGSVSASNVPTLAQCGQVLKSCAVISVSAALSLSAGSSGYFEQRIVGADWRNFAHKPMTVTFWHKSNVTGTYCLFIQNSVGNMSYVTNYSLSSTSWEKKSFFIPEAPTAGTWDYSLGIGLVVGVCLAAGTTFNTATAGNWSATNVMATSAQINFYGNTGNVARFAAFTLQEGYQTALPEERRYTDELTKCQQQLFVVQGGASGSNIGSGVATTPSSGAQLAVRMPVVMRAAPTMSVQGAGVIALTDGFIALATANNVTINAFGSNSSWVSGAVSAPGAAMVAGRPCFLFAGSGANVIFKAEL